MNRKIKNNISIILATIMLLAFAPIIKANAAVTWSSTDKYGSWTNNEYTLYNDVWGTGSGAQTIWANSFSNWGVWSAQPNTSGIKSYPNVSKTINKKISTINTLTSNFNTTVPTSGIAMETAYDIWVGNNEHEIMLWMNEYGNVGPISDKYNALGNAVPYYTNVSVGGHIWNIYKGNNGANMVYTFVRTSKTSSAMVDIKAILNWIKNTPKWFGDLVVGQVQFGYEITSSYNNGSGYNFVTNSYSVTSN